MIFLLLIQEFLYLFSQRYEYFIFENFSYEIRSEVLNKAKVLQEILYRFVCKNKQQQRFAVDNSLAL